MKKIGEFFKKVFSKENLKKFYRTYIWLMVLLFVVDIVTKWVVLNHFGVAAMDKSVHAGVVTKVYDNGVLVGEYSAIQIIKNFVYIGGSINDGAAFSMLAGKRIALLLISLVMTGAFIAYYAIQYKKLTTVYKVALALMIAGAFGNLIDRAFYWPNITGFDGVIDWIIFKFGANGGEFAMFNIADSCLVIGIIVVLIAIIVEEVKEVKARAKRGEYKYSPEELEKMNKEKETQENKENEANKDE